MKIIDIEDLDDLTDRAIEKVGCEWSHDQYKDCETLEDFKLKQKEIQMLTFHHMKIIS